MDFLYWSAFSFLSGLWLSLAKLLPEWVTPEVLGILLAFSLAGALLSQRKLLTFLSVLIFFFGLGILNGARVGMSAAEKLQPYCDREVVAVGSVDPASVRREEGEVSLLLLCSSLQTEEGSFPYAGKLRLRLSERSSARGKEQKYAMESKSMQEKSKLLQLLRAERLAVRGTLRPLISMHNPGGFDADTYYRVQGIGGRLQKAELLTLPANEVEEKFGSGLSAKLQACLSAWSWFAYDLRQTLQQSSRHGALLAGMLLGGNASLDEETREIFSANGLSHLLSVSGTHILLLSYLLSLLLRPLPERWRKFCILGGVFAYALLCGLRPPVLRALFVLGAVLLGGRGAERGRLLACAALVLLAVQPLWLLDMGFQLSFAAAAGLLWLLPACERVLPELLPDVVREALAVTLAAQLAALPLLVSAFHQLPLLALAGNLLLLPVLELAAVLNLAGACLQNVGMLFGYPAELLLGAGDFLLDAVLGEGSLLAALPWANPTLGTLPAWCALLYYAALMLWADLPCVRFVSVGERKAFLVGTSCVLGALFAWQIWGWQELTVYFLDVGQGDCVVLRTPRRQTIIYDTGGQSYLDTGKRVLVPFLRSLGVRRVDALLLSHYDLDHVGGAMGLLNSLPVEEIVLPCEELNEKNLPWYKALTQEAARRGVRLSVAASGRTWDLGEQGSLMLFAPTGRRSGNAASTLAALTSPRGSLLLTGDLPGEAEGAYAFQHFTALKVGHHGSKNSSTEEFLAQVRPQYAIISCGAGNLYGHPHQEVLARLQASGAQILRTDEGGCIKLSFTPQEVRAQSFRQEKF